MTSWLYNCLWQTLHLQPLILSKFTITAGHGRNLCRKTRHISKKINLDITYNKVIMFSNGTTCYIRDNVMSQSLHQQSALILISTFEWLSSQKDENLFLWIFQPTNQYPWHSAQQCARTHFPMASVWNMEGNGIISKRLILIHME